jgi:hypothetical protein
VVVVRAIDVSKDSALVNNTPYINPKTSMPLVMGFRWTVVDGHTTEAGALLRKRS